MDFYLVTNIILIRDYIIPAACHYVIAYHFPDFVILVKYFLNGEKPRYLRFYWGRCR